MKIHRFKQLIINRDYFDKNRAFNEFERCRSLEPIVYNIETTNACNMRCQMCPRTTMMTRKIETLDMDIFKKIVSEIKPYKVDEWETWQSFVEEIYGIDRNEMNENHFFLHIIPKVLVLHGYGDPLLDKFMPERVKILTEKGIPSYFSCNPSNINIDKNLEIFKNGLDYIKYSIESVDDFLHKRIRGEASNFSESYQKICRLIKAKEKGNYETTVVITMLDLNRKHQQQEFEKLKDAFKGLDVYIYLKSQDQQWYGGEYHGTHSIHWLEFCQFPWSSMTIKSNGDAVECVEDFNNEIIFGNVKVDSLYNIWNSEKYTQFRMDHFDIKPGIKCTEQCDMKIIGDYF